MGSNEPIFLYGQKGAVVLYSSSIKLPNYGKISRKITWRSEQKDT
jgi:hypothetical protein